MGDPTGYDPLRRLVEDAEPHRLLPDRLQGNSMVDRLELVDAAPLDDDLWLAVMRGETGQLLAGPLVITDGAARRAQPGDGAAARMLEVLESPRAVLGERFEVIRIAPGAATGDAPERPMLVDQTHESVVVADAAVVKWAVHAEPTPATTLVPHLAAAGFSAMAEPWGFVTWNAGEQPILVMSAVGYLEGASDGWTWAVDDAGLFTTGEKSLDLTVAPFQFVGAQVAELHAALATPTPVIAVPSSMASAADVVRWTDLAASLLEQAIVEVDGVEGDRLRQQRQAMTDVLSQLVQVETTTTIPVHGDLHVGQVLRWSGGYAIGDFDGNPVLPVSARLDPQPAARDIAGMVQSIDHVGRVVNRRVDGADPSRTGKWILAAQSRFVAAYLARLESLEASPLFDRRLLRPFQVEQECREFLYAVRHLPRWRYVPDAALPALLGTDMPGTDIPPID